MFYKYIFKRFLLIIPNLFIILTLNFFIIQIAPGGPIERFISQINHLKINNEVINNDINKNFNSISSNNKYYGSQGVDEELIKKIEKNYGFDLPLLDRYYLLLKKFLVFEFGESFYQDKKIIDLIKEKLPVSISIGLWTILITHLIAIPLGIKKAIRSGTKFDTYSSSIIIVLYAIPSFLLAIFFIMLFCGGNFLNIFPLKGLVSSNFNDLNFFQKILDYFWHLFLPILSMILSGFASLTFFTKNSFMEEINKNYVLCAKAKGLSTKKILYFHIFRNAMLIVIAGFPAMLLGIFFSSSMLIEVIFSLDGLGLLSYEAVISRDYPLIFASVYIFTLLGLIANIISDITYRLVDPRIDFESKNI